MRIVDLTYQPRDATKAQRLAESMETSFPAPFYFDLRPLETGAPTLAQRLCSSGCTDLRIATKEVP